MLREILENLNEKISKSEDEMIMFIIRRVGNGDVKVKKVGADIQVSFKSMYEPGVISDLDNLQKSFPKEFKKFELKRDSELGVSIVKKGSE